MKHINRILNVVLTIGLIFMGLIVAISFFSSPEAKGFLGYKGYTVVSGSMEPALSPGDFILVKLDPYEKIIEEDIVTFQTTDQVVVTHRVTQLDEETFHTKGDANNAVDLETVSSDRYIGRVKWGIPYLGSFLIFLQNPRTVMVLTMLVIIWLLVAYYISGKDQHPVSETQNEEEK